MTTARSDICTRNALHGLEHEPELDTRIVPGRMYTIEYHHSRHFPLGPGEQPAVSLPLTQVPPPLKMEESIHTSGMCIALHTYGKG
ncbi:hypothetical protein BV20DRAFT_1084141 [Pilatotrama ljubarskyi]|nr:hypothetical protein BV20DRAFT_1084141 [Pilatotrama ljubarskyi]